MSWIEIADKHELHGVETRLGAHIVNYVSHRGAHARSVGMLKGDVFGPDD